MASEYTFRIRWEVTREDGTVFKDYTPIIYYSYEECMKIAKCLNEQNKDRVRRSVPVYHFVEEVSSKN